MSTATTQNDDLIILSDNISSTFGSEPVISQDLNFTDNNSIISFDTPNLDGTVKEESSILGAPVFNQENNINFESPGIMEEPKTETLIQEQPAIVQEPQAIQNESKELDSSISNLFGDLNFGNQEIQNNDTINVINDQQQEVIIEKDEFIQDNANLNNLFVENEEEKSLNLNQENVEEPTGDMNSILESTIVKLKKRQTGITLQKSGKIITINDLEAKIKELREQVAYLKKEIVFLDEENIKIEINIGNLESMKIGKQVKVASKTREHNTKKLIKQTKPV